MSNFEKLIGLNVNDKTEKKNGLTYLSWAWAWAEFIKVYPDATYRVKKNDNGMPYFKDESGAFVYTEVTAGGITHEMWLCVMNHMNKAIKAPDSFEVNKSVMRCLTKNLAMFGLGLYIYAGEDLPETNKEEVKEPIKPINTEVLTQEQVLEIEALISQSGADRDRVLGHFGVDSVELLPYERALKSLQAKIKKAS